MYHDYHKITTYSYSSWAEMTCSNITSSGLRLVSFIFIPVGSVSCALRPQGEEVWFGISFFQYLIHHHTSLTDQYFLEHPQSCFSPPTHPVGADGGPVLSQRPGAPMNTHIGTGLDYLTIQCCLMPSLDDSLAAHPSPHIIKVLHYKDLLSNPATF